MTWCNLLVVKKYAAALKQKSCQVGVRTHYPAKNVGLSFS